MSDTGQIEKVVANLQEALVFLKTEVAKAQVDTKKALEIERQAEETLTLARQKLSECTQKEVACQKSLEDIAARENKIRRYEDFETQLVSLDRDRAALSNERVAFNTEVRRKREELNNKAEEILQARKELDQQKKLLEQDRKAMRQEILQSIIDKEL
jgi:hypothetical protein